MTITYDGFATPLGYALIAATSKGVCMIGLNGNHETLLKDLESRFTGAPVKHDPHTMEMYAHQLKDYLEGRVTSMHFPIDERGTDFQKTVWKTLRATAYGEIISYSELAARAGYPKAVRAVATACGANPVAIHTPCHRIIHKDGSMSGYYWGTDIKQKLLALEASQPSRKAA